jgi:hypothetical protein
VLRGGRGRRCLVGRAAASPALAGSALAAATGTVKGACSRPTPMTTARTAKRIAVRWVASGVLHRFLDQATWSNHHATDYLQGRFTRGVNLAVPRSEAVRGTRE